RGDRTLLRRLRHHPWRVGGGGLSKELPAAADRNGQPRQSAASDCRPDGRVEGEAGTDLPVADVPGLSERGRWQRTLSGAVRAADGRGGGSLPQERRGRPAP